MENPNEILKNCFSDGKPVTFKEMFDEGMYHLGQAHACFFELVDRKDYAALTYMIDCAIKWAEALIKDKEPLGYAMSEEPVLGFRYEDAHK